MIFAKGKKITDFLKKLKRGSTCSWNWFETFSFQVGMVFVCCKISCLKISTSCIFNYWWIYQTKNKFDFQKIVVWYVQQCHHTWSNITNGDVVKLLAEFYKIENFYSALNFSRIKILNGWKRFNRINVHVLNFWNIVCTPPCKLHEVCINSCVENHFIVIYHFHFITNVSVLAIQKCTSHTVKIYSLPVHTPKRVDTAHASLPNLSMCSVFLLY